MDEEINAKIDSVSISGRRMLYPMHRVKMMYYSCGANVVDLSNFSLLTTEGNLLPHRIANQQVQAAATADSSQLESFPLSALSADDSGPPQVNYHTEQPLAASTPRANSTSTQETQATDTYHQMIPGMSEHLYPTLIADGLLNTPAADNCSTLQKQITSEIDKYLQEATEKRERDDNSYDGQHVATNTSSPQEEANFLEQDDNAGSDEEDNKESVQESNG